MIKGDYMYDKLTSEFYKWVGAALAMLTIGSKTQIRNWTISIHIPVLIIATLIYLAFYFLGLGLAHRSRKLLHTPVNNIIINPHETLKVAQIYYLNGYTPILFHRNDTDHSGKFIFIFGEDRVNLYLTPDEVKTYVSISEER